MKELSIVAKIYVWTMICLGTGLVVLGLLSLPGPSQWWLLFTVLLVCTSIAQLFPVFTPKNQAYYVSPVFMFAGVLLLPAGALVLLIIACLVPEWIRLRYRWHIQLFNMANLLVSAFLSRELFVMLSSSQLISPLPPLSAIAAVLAAALFTILNHTFLAIVLRLARNYSWKETLLFKPENLLTDATLACTGIITALLWKVDPVHIYPGQELTRIPVHEFEHF
ncbi:MAG: hypothetical protein M1305_06780 [Candidatus Marsarchaeota archaeon]|nr:hypothetical protein [Candidatus Marsarchaeota archaeon]